MEKYVLSNSRNGLSNLMVFNWFLDIFIQQPKPVQCLGVQCGPRVSPEWHGAESRCSSAERTELEIRCLVIFNGSR